MMMGRMMLMVVVVLYRILHPQLPGAVVVRPWPALPLPVAFDIKRERESKREGESECENKRG